MGSCCKGSAERVSASGFQFLFVQFLFGGFGLEVPQPGDVRSACFTEGCFGD